MKHYKLLMRRISKTKPKFEPMMEKKIGKAKNSCIQSIGEEIHPCKPGFIALIIYTNRGSDWRKL